MLNVDVQIFEVFENFERIFGNEWNSSIICNMTQNIHQEMRRKLQYSNQKTANFILAHCYQIFVTNIKK
jgi:hypothetical protein